MSLHPWHNATSIFERCRLERYPFETDFDFDFDARFDGNFVMVLGERFSGVVLVGGLAS